MLKISSILILLSFLCVVSCTKKAPDTPVTTVPERLEINPATTSIAVGSNTTFSVKFFNTLGVEASLPANAVWSTADNAIATINQQGVVTGVAAGQTTVKITYNSILATALVTVTATTVPERLVIVAATNSVAAASTITLTLTYFNNMGVQTAVPAGVIWSSTNNSIATVNQQGVVTGVAAGQVNINATLNTIMATVLITVTNPNVPERLEVSPGAASVATGTTASFTLTYYNNMGVAAPVPPGIVWSSANNSIATVSQQGVVTGVAEGQTTVKATLNTAVFTTATVTVTANAQLATITLNPSSLLEVNLNQSSAVTATGMAGDGTIINGLNFTWASSNNNIVAVNNGLVQGLAYGTANITATAASISSPPLMVQVVRSGTFNGAFNSMGQAKLKIENGVLKLETSSNFSVSTGAPDLRIYLSNSTGNITNSVEVATLNMRSGAQSWAVPVTNNQGQPVTITTYPFVLVWCRQFGGNYGHVVLP